jgi:hypothetical protein
MPDGHWRQDHDLVHQAFLSFAMRANKARVTGNFHSPPPFTAADARAGRFVTAGMATRLQCLM